MVSSQLCGLFPTDVSNGLFANRIIRERKSSDEVTVPMPMLRVLAVDMLA